jgi:hypothetical protein
MEVAVWWAPGSTVAVPNAPLRCTTARCGLNVIAAADGGAALCLGGVQSHHRPDPRVIALPPSSAAVEAIEQASESATAAAVAHPGYLGLLCGDGASATSAGALPLEVPIVATAAQVPVGSLVLWATDVASGAHLRWALDDQAAVAAGAGLRVGLLHFVLERLELVAAGCLRASSASATRVDGGWVVAAAMAVHEVEVPVGEAVQLSGELPLARCTPPGFESDAVAVRWQLRCHVYCVPAAAFGVPLPPEGAEVSAVADLVVPLTIL